MARLHGSLCRRRLAQGHPTFDDTCAQGWRATLDFDGHGDALLHPFDGAGRTYMQYVRDDGPAFDVPAKFLMREMARDYANMQGEDLTGRTWNGRRRKGDPSS